MHAKQIGRHRSSERATDRSYVGSHRNTQTGRFRMDWTWGGLLAWALAYWAASIHTARHDGPLFRAPQMLRGIRFMDRLTNGPLPVGHWARPVEVVLRPSWAIPTMASIQATPWEQ